MSTSKLNYDGQLHLGGFGITFNLECNQNISTMQSPHFGSEGSLQPCEVLFTSLHSIAKLHKFLK